jgi:hypothetical protein
VKLGALLAHLHGLETRLARDYRSVGERHAGEHDVFHQGEAFAKQAAAHAEQLAPHVQRLGAETGDPTGRAEPAALPAGLELLDDLRGLFLAAEDVSITWVMAGQAAQATRDAALLETVSRCHLEVELQVKWLTTRIKVAAPQALVVG